MINKNNNLKIVKKKFNNIIFKVKIIVKLKIKMNLENNFHQKLKLMKLKNIFLILKKILINFMIQLTKFSHNFHAIFAMHKKQNFTIKTIYKLITNTL